MLTTIVIHDQNHLLNDLKQHLHLFDPEISIPACNQFSWVKNWSTHYLQDDDKLFICIHKDQQKTAAYYSLYLKKLALGYELRFIGTGEPECSEVCSEFQDFIIHPTYLQESLTLFTEQVKQLKHCYRISFDNILPESSCYRWLRSYQTFGWMYRKQCVGKRYLLPIADDEPSQISRFPQTTLRRHARRFLDKSDITVEYCEKHQDIPHFFDVLIKLHTEQWQLRGKPGAFTNEQFRQFHLNFADSMLEKNKLLLFKLNFAGTAIAVFYGFYHQDTLYYYQSGISKESPLPNTGVGMHLIAMRHGRNANCMFYDLMKGSDESYKNSFVTSDTPVYTINYSQLIYTYMQKIVRIFVKLALSLKWRK